MMISHRPVYTAQVAIWLILAARTAVAKEPAVQPLAAAATPVVSDKETIVALIAHAAKPASTSQPAADVPLNILKTPAGVRFGVLGPKPATPAPVLFVFANDI